MKTWRVILLILAVLLATVPTAAGQTTAKETVPKYD